MQVQALKPNDFTEDRFGTLFTHVLTHEGGLKYAPGYFFPSWRLWMDMGFAHVWAIDDSAALGALFTKDIFGGQLRGQVVFWFALPEVRHTPVTGLLFRTFEYAAQDAGCVDIQSAAHFRGNPERREAKYLANGFVKTESIFTKKLVVGYE